MEREYKECEWREEVLDIMDIVSWKHSLPRNLGSRDDCQRAKTSLLELIANRTNEIDQLNHALALLEKGWTDEESED